MKLYYKAVSPNGEAVQGLIDASDINEAAIYLRSKELIPVKIFRKEKSPLLNLLPFGKKIKSKDIVAFTRQMSAMLASGITLIKALEILKNQIGSVALAELVDGMIGDIQEGASFSAAVSKYPEVFSPVYVSLIKAAEESGILDKEFLRLADTMEKQQKLKGTIKGALTYPIIVVVMMGLVAAIMMIFVMPQVSNLYKSLNVDLPLPTQIVIGLSNFTVNFWFVPLLSAFLGVYFFRRWYRTLAGRLVIDSILLKVPIFGNLVRKTILAEFARILGILLASGTLIVESLHQVADTTGNIHYRNAIMDISKRVEKGVTLGDAMSLYALFPPSLVELVKIGEQTGKLDETLIKASEYFETEVDQVVKTLSTALEPAIMVVLGIGVAFLVISIITPIYQITSSIQ